MSTVWFTLLGLACGPQPTTLDYPSEVTLHDRSLMVPAPAVLDAEGQRLDLPVRVASSKRAEIVKLTTDGFSCVANGSSEVLLVAGSLEHLVQVRCALVDAVELSETHARLVLPKVDGQLQTQIVDAPTVKVMGPDGPVLDQELVAVSSDTQRLRILEDGRLEALRPGRATVTYTAGGQRAEYVVDIGRLIDDRLVLKVPPGGRSTLPLEPGPTWLDLRSGVRVTAHLEGERCPEAASGRNIQDLYCELGDRGMLVIQNPSRSTARVTAKLVVVPE